MVRSSEETARARYDDEKRKQTVEKQRGEERMAVELGGPKDERVAQGSTSSSVEVEEAISSSKVEEASDVSSSEASTSVNESGMAPTKRSAQSCSQSARRLTASWRARRDRRMAELEAKSE